MGKTIGVISVKGGVGKTTIASSLAADLVNHYGKRVLLVDANYSAPNLGLHMDIVKPGKTIHDVLDGDTRITSAIHNKYGVHVIPGSYSYKDRLNYMKLKDKLKRVKGDYDFTIIDTSPTLNNEILSAILASDDLFVVTTPDYPTLSCSLSAAKLAKQRGKPIRGIIVNKIRDPGYELSLKDIEESCEIPVVARIPDDKVNVRALFTRIPTSIYDKKSDFAKEINRLNAALTNSNEKKKLLSFFRPKGFKRVEVNRQMLRDSFYRSLFNER
jgi:septum site-determining protein MinD